MNKTEIEAWVLRVVDLVRSGAPVEDARVELKATFIDPVKAARRMAGHANAACPDPVLWLIGVAETGECGLPDSPPFAAWMDGVKSCFDGLYPTICELSVPIDDTSVFALVIETDRAPFVVKNPRYGMDPGPVALEVPFRDGTAIRSARREDLIRILVPQSRSPAWEVLSGVLKVWDFENHPQKAPHFAWRVELDVYFTPRSAGRLIYPAHRAAIELLRPGESAWEPAEVSFTTAWAYSPVSGVRDLSFTIRATPHEALVDGPGALKVVGQTCRRRESLPEGNLRVRMRLAGIDVPEPVEADLELTAVPPVDAAIATWKWVPIGSAGQAV